jgi:uncharacterized membrane protein (UPF0127 family)
MPKLVHNGSTLVPDLQIAGSFTARAKGLLGRNGLPPGQGLLIRPCRSIHTWFMRFPIDVIFLDTHWRIVRVVLDLDPWRLAWGGHTAAAVVEVQSGWLPPLQPGETLKVELTA